MPGGDRFDVRKAEGNEADVEESRALLSLDEDDPPARAPSPPSTSKPHAPIYISPSNGQPRTPRTPNRVRFDLDDDTEEDGEEARSHHIGHPSSWLEEDDYMNGDGSRAGRSSTGQLAPLLTNIEAPSVTLATSEDFFPEDHLEGARPTSGLRNAFMNMANSIIGAGIIGQPYAFRQAGLMVGIILLCGLTVTVDWTIRLIVINSKLSGADSFQTTVEFCFGRPGLIAISIAQWAFAFGGMVAFCIIVGDTIPHVFASIFPSLKDTPFLWLLTDRRAVIVLFVLGISYPLSLYRDIAKLAKASTLALVSMLVIVVTVIVEGIRVPADLRGDPLHFNFWQGNGFFQAVGVISFDHNSLLIYGSLKKPTMDRFALVTHYSTGISMVMCLIMALAGFFTFGEKTKGNVLNNFPSDNVMVNIARLCFGLNMLATLPLEAFVCRSVMTTFFFPDEPYNLARHVIFTSALVVTSVALSLLTCDLGAVFELIGATSACALAYILPPLCYAKLSKGSWKEKSPAYACILFGSIVLCTSVVQAIIKIIKTMDEEERLRRMQELQMADLGSARREYISTVDAQNKYQHIGLDQIEAIRATNIKGSKVQKLAETNKAQLNAWNNAHETIGGDVQLEDLDSMMSGQSHRAQLCDLIKAKGGQEYIHGSAAPPKGPSRGSRGAARGGGVTGRRGRDRFSNSPFAPQNTPSPCVLGSGGGHAAENTPDPARSDANENFSEKDTRIGEVGVAPRTTKSDRGFRGRGRPGTVKTRRVVDPSANFQSMLADPSDFMAVAKVHSASGPSDPPRPTQNAATQPMAPSNQDKQEHLTKDEGISRNALLKERIKGSETQIYEDTISATLANDQELKGTILLEHNAKSTAGKTWAIQVDSLPSDGIGTGQTDFGELKTDKRFRSSLPQPIHASEESTLFIDLMRKSRSPSNPASPIRPRHMDSGTNIAPMSSFLANAPPSMRTLLPEIPTSSASAKEAGKAQNGTDNGGIKNTFDLIIDRLQRELDQVNQIIEDTPEPVKSTDIGAYLLSRKQQLESELTEAIEIESDVVRPFSTLTLEDPSQKQPNEEHNASQEMPIPKPPVAPTDNQEGIPLIPGSGSTPMSSGLPNVDPQQDLLMSSHTPPIPTPTSSTFTNSVPDIIGDHLLPGRKPSTIESDPGTPKITSGNNSLYDFSTPPAPPATGESMTAQQATEAFDHSSTVNQLQVRDTPNIPDNAKTRQYMESASDTNQRSAKPRDLPLNSQRNHPLLTATQQFSSSTIHPPMQSDQLSSPISYMTGGVQHPASPSPSKPAPQAPQYVSSSELGVPLESTEQVKPSARNDIPRFPMSAATMQYSGALFQCQEQNAAPQSAATTTPSCHNPPGGPSKPSTPAFVPSNGPPPPAGQESRNPSTASATRKNSEASASSSINPPRLSGLENSRWATSAGAPTSPKGASRRRPSPEPSNGRRGINMFIPEMAKHQVTASKSTVEESTTNSGSSKRQRESSGLESSKWAN
ncbi:solute carrier family 38 (sodium-coupled neutral amino acid transporter), member 11 [Blastomyces parvus]|uniref:Solute carrier family 38 (Sodium-coupled neutral amino acid transporter), member 11 n=1 Tax=Blastomyces parvus TaxID=2060905 RepID=A0A2B7XG45_9EURO|nr:solute carrier family 38 (sodium-coupled neutral amino acid transporter), member 11 [Blastomyces parvus]